MDKPRVLVVIKRSVLEALSDPAGGHDLERRLSGDPELRGRLDLAHRENLETVARVQEALRDRGLDFDALPKPLLARVKGYGLVVTVGGDGTFLDVASRVLDSTPMLGVNSSTSSSVGHFSAADASSFPARLDAALEGRLDLCTLYRVQVEVDGRPVGPPALNEVLYAHREPAGTSRYLLRVGDHEERHKSSGVWVSTASGSTGAICSAGGIAMDITLPEIQFLVREPYRRPGADPTMLQGVCDEPIEILNLIHGGGLFFDGTRFHHALKFADPIRFRPGMYPLRVYR